jgi:SAM-dependent methyltransferase
MKFDLKANEPTIGKLPNSTKCCNIETSKSQATSVMIYLRWKIAQYFELKWWKNYFSKRDPTEYKKWKSDYWLWFLEKINEWVNPLQNQNFLDMGCGPAGIFMVLPGKVTAVDPLLDVYKAHLIPFKPANFENVTFISARAEDYKCNSQFDIVFSLNVINHVTNIKQATATLYKCCKNGGQLVLSADTHNYNFLKTIFRYLHFDILHPYQLTLEEYKKLLENEGFVVLVSKCLKKKFIFSYMVIIAEKL